MLHVLAMIGPILLPSWRFFKTVGPSPRIEWCNVDQGLKHDGDWQTFRPRPKHVPVCKMLLQLIWNPTWNEALYLVSCCERVAQNVDAHAVAEIRAHVAQYLQSSDISGPFKFRLVFVSRQGEEVQEDVLFVSEAYAQSITL